LFGEETVPFPSLCLDRRRGTSPVAHPFRHRSGSGCPDGWRVSGFSICFYRAVV